MAASAGRILLTALFLFSVNACISQWQLPESRALKEDPTRAPTLFSKFRLSATTANASAFPAYTGNANCEDYTFSIATGNASVSESIYTVRTLTDGCYILGGAIKAANEQSGLLIKLNKDGSVQWANKYAQAGFNFSYNNIQATNDGGWIAAGISQQNANAQTYLVVSKFSAAGNQEWTREFNYTGINSPLANTNVALMDNGGYAFSGNTGTDMILGSLTSDGSTKWIKQLNFGGDQYYSVGLAPDYNGVFGAVASMDSAKHIGYVFKLDSSNGNTLWSTRLGSYASGEEYLFQDMKAVNGRPRICGLHRQSPGSPWEFSRITISPSGFAESGDYFGLPAAPDTTSFSGSTPWSEYHCISLSTNLNDVYLVKAIPDLYTKNYWCHKITQQIPFTVSAIERSFDGGVIIVGNSPVNNGDIMITKTDSSGFMATCTAVDIPYTHRFERDPPHAKGSPVNISFLQTALVPSINQLPAQVDQNVFCRQLYCQPLPDSSCVTTFSNTYRDYYFSQLARSIVESAGGNLIVGGSSRDNPYDASDRGFLTVINKSGKVLSSKNIDYGGIGSIVRVIALKDSSIVTAGQGRAGAKFGAVFSRYDKNLNLQWENSFVYNYYDDVVADSSDNIYQSSLINPSSFDPRLVMTKLDAAGNIAWRNTYAYFGKTVRLMEGGQLCVVNNLLFTSFNAVVNNKIATLVLCFNTNDGSIKWSRVVDAVATNEVRMNAQIFSQNNLLYLSGYIEANNQSLPGSALLELDLNGNVLRNKRFYGPQQIFSFHYTAAKGGTMIGLTFAYDYSYTPALPLRMFMKLDANLNVTRSRVNVNTGGTYSRRAIVSDDGFIYELGGTLIEEPYNNDFSIRKMEPDGTTGNCLTDSLHLEIGGYTFISTPLTTATMAEPVIPLALTRKEAERRISLSKQDCVSKSRCDTLFLTGSTNFCDTALFTISTHRSIGCTAGVSWAVDTNILRIISRTDTALQLRFRKSGQTTIRAMLSNGCRIFSDSLHLQSTIIADSLELGPTISLCPNNSVTLHAPNTFSQYEWQDGSTDSTFQVRLPGRYYVTITTLCNTRYSDTVLVTAALPVTIDIGPDKTSCNNDTVQLAAPAGFVRYTWYSDHSADTLNGQSVIVNPTISQRYYLVAEKTRGCFARDTLQVNVQAADPLYLGKDSSFCKGDSLVLTANRNFTSYRWSTGDTSAAVTVRKAGSYWLNAKNSFGCFSRDTIAVPFVYDNPTVNLNKNPQICKGEVRQLVAGAPGASYLWYDGTTQPTHAVSSTGRYWVLATDLHNCKASDTVNITTEVMPPQNFLMNDTTLCAYQHLIIAPSGNYTSYSWNTGAATSSVTISQTGQYTLTVMDRAGCSGKDTVIVNPKECTHGIFFPSAFSPNTDGINEVFRPRVYGELIRYELQLYNRFGQLIFSTNDYLTGWNGKTAGKLQDNGGFAWICRWQFKNEKEEFRKGIALLLK